MLAKSTLARLRNKRGFTLVELMIVVAIIGVLAALAIYGVTRYLASAKTAEARNNVGRLAKDGAAVYNGETMAGTVLAAGGTAAPSHRMCPAALKSVPDTKTKIAKMKYQSDPAEWEDGADATTKLPYGWKCLKFAMDSPQYFMYNYTTPSATSFLATAQGDLDGDGNLSTFSMEGVITGDTMKLAPGIKEENPDE
ncbi:MAG: type II secretion system protein [Polyangiaceae bacterium]|nr:type II secretion system protein [Polyangiaceae bacterium]